MENGIDPRRFDVGPEMDAAICRYVLGMPEEKIARLIARRRLPKYSTSFHQAGVLRGALNDLDSGWMRRFLDRLEADYIHPETIQNRKWDHVSWVVSSPLVTCDVALRTIRATGAD